MLQPHTSSQHPFSLGDPEIIEGILTGSGFAELSVTDVGEPIYYIYQAFSGWSPCVAAVGRDLAAQLSRGNLDREAVENHSTAQESGLLSPVVGR